MKTEITNHTEALVWALALAIVAPTTAQYLEAMESVEYFASHHLPSEIKEAKKQALALVEEWEAQEIHSAITGEFPAGFPA